MLRKCLLAALTACLTIATASSAHADSALMDAFNSATGAASTTSDAGYFKSQVRNTVSGGSGSIRFGQNAPVRALGINVTPPDISVGCSGIDWHLGGFSWVNSTKIKQMLQGMVQGASMYVIQMALGVICEDCAAQLQSVMDTIRQVGAKQMDSCQLGSQLAESSVQYAGSSLCQSNMADTNQTASYAEGRLLCDPNKAAISLSDSDWFMNSKSSIQSLADRCSGGLISCFGSLSDENKTAANESVEQSSNRTRLGMTNVVWEILKRRGLILDPRDLASLDATGLTREAKLRRANAGYALGELAMSMIGTRMPMGPNATSLEPVAPTLRSSSETNAAIGVVMCGQAFFTGNFDSRLYQDADALSGLSQRSLSNLKENVRNICGQIFTTSAFNNPDGQPPAQDLNILTCQGSRRSRQGGGLGRLGTMSPAEIGEEVQSNYANCLPPGESNSQSYELAKVSISDWFEAQYVSETIGIGTLALSIGTMESIVAKIRCYGPSGLNVAGGCTGNPEFTDSEIAFIENAPFPLYKILNQAAIFPAMRGEIMETFGRLVGLMMSRQFILNYFQNMGAFADQGQGGTKQFLTDADEMITQKLTGLTDDINGSLDDIRTGFQRAQAIRTFILQTEQSLRDSIFARNLMGNEQFTMDIATPRRGEDSSRP